MTPLRLTLILHVIHAASLREGGGVSRVAQGPRLPDEGGELGEGGAPPPQARRSGGNRPAEPPEPSPVHRQGHPPSAGFSSGVLQLLTSDRCLSYCLSADAQGSSDLGPTGTFPSGGIDHEVRGDVEALSGVSQPLEVLQRLLRAALDAVEALGCPADPPPGCGACLGAHVNGSCHRLRGFGQSSRQPLLTTPNSPRITANWQLAPELFGGVLGVPSEAASLISSYISRQRVHNGPQTTEKNDPRDVGASGGLITSQEQ